jgi:hypothetical protein
MTLPFAETPLYSASPEKFIMSATLETRRRSLEDPEGFWGEVAEGIDWIKGWDRVLDSSNPPFYRWFPGAQLNTCYNALDRHVEKRGNQAALIYDSAVTHQRRTYTYRQLRDEVAIFAGALASHGVTKGDRVLLYMPMIPEAVISMLACARLGAVRRSSQCSHALDSARCTRWCSAVLLPRSSQRASMTQSPKQSFRHRAVSKACESSNTNPCSTRPSTSRSTSPERASSVSAKAASVT